MEPRTVPNTQGTGAWPCCLAGCTSGDAGNPTSCRHRPRGSSASQGPFPRWPLRQGTCTPPPSQPLRRGDGSDNLPRRPQRGQGVKRDSGRWEAAPTPNCKRSPRHPCEKAQQNHVADTPRRKGCSSCLPAWSGHGFPPVSGLEVTLALPGDRACKPAGRGSTAGSPPDLPPPEPQASSLDTAS